MIESILPAIIAPKIAAGQMQKFGWEAEAPTDRQRERLEKAGILPDEIDSAGKASKLLERLDKRRDAGLTTPKQIRFLEGRGFRHVGTWTFDSAKQLIDRIAANGWRTPKEITPAEYRPELMQTADGRLVGAETSKLFYWDGEVV